MEIICVGNELLIGKTLNTNAQWLAKGATALGVNIKRITTIGDDVQELKWQNFQRELNPCRILLVQRQEY